MRNACIRRAFCLRVRAFTNPPIGQALARLLAELVIAAVRVDHQRRLAGGVGGASWIVEIGGLPTATGGSQLTRPP